MHANELKNQIVAAIEKHAVAAQVSEYDRTVSITAVAAARSVVGSIIPDNPVQIYAEQISSALKSLLQTYNDSDGEYTNGRGVIGSLLGDVEAVIQKADPT